MQGEQRAGAITFASVTGAPTKATLPPDLLEQAASRLGLLSLIYAATYAVAFYPGEIIGRLGGDVPYSAGPVEHTAAAVSILASILIFVLTRTVSWNPLMLLDLGLIYLVVSSFGIAVAEIWRVSFAGHGMVIDAGAKPWFGISWTCVWVISFPVIAPATPGKTLLAALAAAAMAPFVLLVSVAAGASEAVPWFVWMGLSVGTVTSALIAFVASRHIYGLGRDIREAREMGSYRLVERLGRGGMGEVWKAEHRMLARPAAIKLIRRDSLQAGVGIGDSEVRRRFEREAQTTAMLSSPHTVELYDFGATDDGRFFYVMELLEGLDLDTFVGRFGAARPERVVDWLLQACDSLQEAHDRALVHRDIKPANIYVCRLGTSVDYVKVLDFGLVKQGLSGDDPTRLTTEGIAAGTPAYMAPEMAEGIAEVDHRVDIYALGCVAYWLLTGNLVFDADSPVKMIVEHVQAQPVPPSQRTEASIPPALDEIVLACLAKSPDDRPQSAAELADRLAESGLADGWTQADARAWWETHVP